MSVGVFYIVNGVVVWCVDGIESNCVKSFCLLDSSEVSENKFVVEIVYLCLFGGFLFLNVVGIMGIGLDFYGVRSDFGFVGIVTGLKFICLFVGCYVLEF